MTYKTLEHLLKELNVQADPFKTYKTPEQWLKEHNVQADPSINLRLIADAQRWLDLKYPDKQEVKEIIHDNGMEKSLIGELVIKDFPKLKKISFIGSGDIFKIEIVNCPQLDDFECVGSPVKEIDFGSSNKLKRIYIPNNLLESIKLPANPTGLVELSAHNNKLSSRTLQTLAPFAKNIPLPFGAPTITYYEYSAKDKEKLKNILSKQESQTTEISSSDQIKHMINHLNNSINKDEEWIKKKMKKEDINYFDYSEFSDIKEIGKGGFGIVNRAVTNDGIQVALKGLINKEVEMKGNVIKDFIKELKLLRRVDYHGNINRFLGITKDDIGYVMVLEYANNGNLRDYLKEKFDSLQWENKIQMALDIIHGLRCLHSKDIIHRDLHSKNILVNDGKLLIADFGLSKQLTEVTSISTANRTGIIEYIDPQCYKSIEYIRGKKADIYSLGVLLWEITSGRPPFCNFSQDEIERDRLRFHIGMMGLREKPIEGTPLEYQQLYQKCWDDDPEKRPDINQVYNEILSQSNANDTHEPHEDPLMTSNNNNLSNVNVQSYSSDLCIESEYID